MERTGTVYYKESLASYTLDLEAHQRRIELSLTVVDRLVEQVMRGFGTLPRRGAEVGGVLLGEAGRDGSRSVIRIEDFEPIPCDYSYGPSFLLSPANTRTLEESLARWEQPESELDVVGFYRSHTRKDFYLSDADLDLFARYFEDPASLFLLIRPFVTRSCVGGIFVWENDRVDGSKPVHTFPFVRKTLEEELLCRENDNSIGDGSLAILRAPATVPPVAAATSERDPEPVDEAPIGPPVSMERVQALPDQRDSDCEFVPFEEDPPLAQELPGNPLQEPASAAPDPIEATQSEPLSAAVELVREDHPETEDVEEALVAEAFPSRDLPEDPSGGSGAALAEDPDWLQSLFSGSADTGEILCEPEPVNILEKELEKKDSIDGGSSAWSGAFRAVWETPPASSGHQPGTLKPTGETNAPDAFASEDPQETPQPPEWWDSGSSWLEPEPPDAQAAPERGTEAPVDIPDVLLGFTTQPDSSMEKAAEAEDPTWNGLLSALHAQTGESGDTEPEASLEQTWKALGWSDPELSAPSAHPAEEEPTAGGDWLEKTLMEDVQQDPHEGPRISANPPASPEEPATPVEIPNPLLAEVVTKEAAEEEVASILTVLRKIPEPPATPMMMPRRRLAILCLAASITGGSSGFFTGRMYATSLVQPARPAAPATAAPPAAKAQTGLRVERRKPN